MTNQKKQLAEDITSAFTKIGTPPEAVHIILKDNPKHNWASGVSLLWKRFQRHKWYQI